VGGTSNKISLIGALLAGGLMLACASCASDEKPSVTATSLSIPDTTSAVQSGDLRVSPLDTLEVKVFGVEDLDGTYQVDPDGKIKIPLIGVIDAKGYTVFDLAKILEKRLGDSFLQDPQVSIRISEAFGQQVTVEGAVQKPGMYPIKSSLTLLQAVALSGGPTELSNPRKVVVFRTIEGKRQAAIFDLVSIRNGKSEDPAIYGNDIIAVDGSDALFNYRELVRSIPLLGVFRLY